MLQKRSCGEHQVVGSLVCRLVMARQKIASIMDLPVGRPRLFASSQTSNISIYSK